MEVIDEVNVEGDEPYQDPLETSNDVKIEENKFGIKGEVIVEGTRDPLAVPTDEVEIEENKLEVKVEGDQDD